MKLFVLLVVALVAWNIYRSVEISSFVDVSTILDYGQRAAKEDLCPEGQKPKYGYGAQGWDAKACYTPTEDAGKTCLQATDCLSLQCLVIDEDQLKDACEFRLESQSYLCSEIIGECGDGGTPEAALSITSKNHVYRKSYY